jgi:hypothetical protein
MKIKGVLNAAFSLQPNQVLGETAQVVGRSFEASIC